MSETDAPHAGFHCDDFPPAIGQDAPGLGELSLLRVDSRHIVRSDRFGLPAQLPVYRVSGSWSYRHAIVINLQTAPDAPTAQALKPRPGPNPPVAKQHRPPPSQPIPELGNGGITYSKMSFTEMDPPISAGKSSECPNNNRGAADALNTLTAFATGFTTQKARQHASAQ